MSNNRHAYMVTLQAEPGLTEEEATRALRGALKALLRQWGLRCTAASPLPLDRPESTVTHDKGTP